jgi:predicted DsbA family dithiol-disulfide isomerase
MSPQKRAQIEASRPMFKRRAMEQYGVEVNPGPLDTNSKPALILEKYAEAQGEEQGEAFHDAVMQAYWHESKNIGDLDVLKQIAQSVGLDTEHFASILENPAYKSEVEQDIDQAREYGIDAVPALVFADKYLVLGAQPYEVLQQVIETVEGENS